MATQWKTGPLRPRPTAEVDSLVDLFRHAASEAGEIIRSEARVIKLELEENTRAIIVDALKATVYGAIALLGLLNLLAFLIIGLADIITRHVVSITSFWASALIIGVVFTTAGGLMATRHAWRMGHDAQLKHSRAEMEIDKQFSDTLNPLKQVSFSPKHGLWAVSDETPSLFR